MENDLLGIIRMFMGTYAPENYKFCDGTLLKIKDYTQLFDVIGNKFGGDGVTYFALPDLRLRAPLGTGTGPGMTPRHLAEKGGQDLVGLTEAQLPPHSHNFYGLSGGLDTTSPVGNFLPTYPDIKTKFYSVKDKATDTLVPMNDQVVSTEGLSIPHDNLPPYLVANFVMCVKGLQPSKPSAETTEA